MSWLLVRSQPRKLAGWQFPQNNTVAGPLVQPFKHLGDGTPADINFLRELHIPANGSTTNGGGESWEWQPFTPHWGIDFTIWWPVGGNLAQAFDAYFTDSWTKIGAAFTNLAGIRISHAPLDTGQTIHVAQAANVLAGAVLKRFPSPIAFNGNYLPLRMWVDDDRWIRVWLGGTYLGSATLHPTYYFGPTRRCVRFLNEASNDAWIKPIHHYDRTPTIPSGITWTQQFYDDFNRGNGPVANGWTVFGAEGQIVNGSYSTTGTSDGSRGILRPTGITNGRMRIETTIGGNIGPNNTADSSIVLCANSGGTAALTANIFGNALYLSRLSGSLTSPTFTDFDSLTGISVASGDAVAWSVFDGVGWLEVNGVRRLYAADVHALVSAGNEYAGLRVERAPIAQNSNSWNDIRILAG
ncbi:hypothetical protein [Nocardia wallacei]|uniref:hypothetical protein n=1 Tax=Nocardia wallacei TaxID=480035 RepID=UPI002455C91F|nr:hypothetical protein [Nocardia wallacei]